MKIEIRNIRGIAAGDIEIAPLAIIGGPNGAGKSSVATAVASALMQTPAPAPGMTKTAARALLRDGAERGRVKLEAEAGRVAVNYPGGSVKAEGEPPRASAVAAGVISPAKMSDKERAAYLIELIKAEPSREELVEAFTGKGIAERAAAACWERVAADGWDATHRYAQQQSTQAKGAWGQITGEQYGPKKADDWRPPVFGDGDIPDAETAAANVEAARSAVESAVSNQAVSSSARERIEADIEASSKARANIETLQLQLAELKTAMQEKIEARKPAMAALEQARAEMQKLPKPGDAEVTVPCPSCGTHVVVVSRQQLGLPQADQSSVNEARSAAIEVARQQVDQLSRDLEQPNRDVQLAESAVATKQQEIDQAWRFTRDEEALRAELQAMNTGGSSAEDVAAARQALEDAELRLSALHSYREAAAKHRAVGAYATMAEILAPSGLRQSVLASRLESFNARLAQVCNKARWGLVAIDSDLQVSYAGRPYPLLSKSEQFRARATLQLACAAFDGSDAIVIDAADILDRQGRNGLFAAVSSAGIPAVIAMTMDAADSMPRLKPGQGRVYWAQGATLHDPHAE